MVDENSTNFNGLLEAKKVLASSTFPLVDSPNKIKSAKSFDDHESPEWTRHRALMYFHDKCFIIALCLSLSVHIVIPFHSTNSLQIVLANVIT
jgi:hypothetical protein